MQNRLIVLSYDGTDYHGWQRQPGKRTIQGALEEALARLAGVPVKIIGAGRTDAGVHALGQAASFKAPLRLGEPELLKALNALLPDDIRIGEVRRVPAGFHALRDAKGKIYRYRICLARTISPFDLRYALHWPYPLNAARMRRAAAGFVRTADFSPFSSNRERHPVRAVVRSEIHRKGQELVYTIEAKGFLRFMVRTIVGTLLEAGRGRVDPSEIGKLFEGGRRTLASPTAPAKGLCLERVLY
jgi:tRNA pseudouridine38-40 synthase